MGKYYESKYNPCFSNWHILRCAPECALSNMDGLWLEVRRHRIAAIYDIKEPKAIITPTEIDVYHDLARHYPIYIIYPSEGLLSYRLPNQLPMEIPEIKFTIKRWEIPNERKVFNEAEFIRFIESLQS